MSTPNVDVGRNNKRTQRRCPATSTTVAPPLTPIDDDGWLHTGDIGHIDADGHLFIVDRLKELIKYKGFQVPPAELESLLLTHPAVADAAVVGAPDDEAGEIPVGFVVLKPEESLSEDELMAFVAGQVANYKQLRRVTFIDAVPKSASGKVLRRAASGPALSMSPTTLGNAGRTPRADPGVERGGIAMLVMSESYAIGSSTPPVRDLTIGGLLREAAAAEPDRVALVAGIADPAARRSWTYAELLDEATTAARALCARSSNPVIGSRCGPRTIRNGSSSSSRRRSPGTILVTVNPAFRCRRSRVRAHSSRGRSAWSRPTSSAVPRCWRRSRRSRRTARSCVRSSASTSGTNCWPRPTTSPAICPTLRRSDAVMIQYTSGTTGFPKGALLHHRGLVNNGAHTADRAGYGDGEVVDRHRARCSTPPGA